LVGDCFILEPNQKPRGRSDVQAQMEEHAAADDGDDKLPSLVSTLMTWLYFVGS
jgi:hypothetical protein